LAVFAIAAAFSATTPPHIRLTNNTLAKGVNLEIHRHNLGSFSFHTTPMVTGARTTLAVARQRDLPLTETVLPTMNFVSRGVTTDAKTVLQAVRRTLRALRFRCMERGVGDVNR
jgi:hypothetical protein